MTKLEKNSHSLPFIYSWKTHEMRLVQWIQAPCSRCMDSAAQRTASLHEALQSSMWTDRAYAVMSHE
jgi:hypothetical protein